MGGLQRPFQETGPREVKPTQELNDTLKNIADGVTALQHEVKRSRCQCVNVSSTTSWRDMIQKIGEIESHGNVKLDLYTGDVDLVKEMEFVPRRQTEGLLAEFVDPDAVEPVLCDIAELAKMFAVPVAIEGHTRSSTKGTDDEFMERLAQMRAELVMGHLEAKGIKKNRMTARSMPGDKGLSRACVMVKFEIFPHDEPRAERRLAQREVLSRSGSPRAERRERSSLM